MLYDGEVLVGIFSKTAAGSPLPEPFQAALLSHPEEDAAWVFDRLRTYRDLEALRRLMQRGAFSEAHLSRLIRALMRPAFVPHLSRCLAEFFEVLVKSEHPEQASLLLEALENGPQPHELRERVSALRQRASALTGS